MGVAKPANISETVRPSGPHASARPRTNERTEMDRLQQTNSDRGEYTIQIPTVTVTVIVTVAVAVAMAVAVAVAVAVMTVAVSLILARIGTLEIMMTMTLRCYEPLTTISKNSPLNLVYGALFKGHCGGRVF